MDKIKLYAKSILIPILIGAVIGIIARPTDFNTLIKPPFAPSGILFPIVWTILYALMGISYGILKEKGLNDEKINNIYFLQLFVNYMWSIIFFLFKWRLFAFFWVVLLAVLVGLMIYRFYNKNKIAGLLQIPYLLWTIFASILNLSIYLLNR